MTTAAQNKPTRRRRMPRAERERQMLDVAESIFAEQGYLATSMDEIAERVGVSKPMLYEYFGSKEGLLIGSIRSARAELLAATERAVADAASAEQALRLGLRAFFVFITEHETAWSLMRNESGLLAGEAAAEIEATRAQQSALMVRLMSATAPEVDQRQRCAAAEIVTGACERLATWLGRYPDTAPDEAAEYMMQVLWFGMRTFTPESAWPPMESVSPHDGAGRREKLPPTK